MLLIKYVPPFEGRPGTAQFGHVVVTYEGSTSREVVLEPQKETNNFRLSMKLRELHGYHKSLQELNVVHPGEALVLKLSETDIDYNATKGILDFWEAVNINHDINDIDGVFSDQAESLLLAHVIDHLVRHVNYSVLLAQASYALDDSLVPGASVLIVLDDTRGWVALLPLGNAMRFITSPFLGLHMFLDIDEPVIHLLSEDLHQEVCTYVDMSREADKASKLLSGTVYPAEYPTPFLDERRKMLYNSIHSLVSEG